MLFFCVYIKKKEKKEGGGGRNGTRISGSSRAVLKSTKRCFDNDAGSLKRGFVILILAVRRERYLANNSGGHWLVNLMMIGM